MERSYDHSQSPRARAIGLTLGLWHRAMGSGLGNLEEKISNLLLVNWSWQHAV